MTVLTLSRLHVPVLTLGHGTRAGIWVQGCTIGCRGCVSQDTWTATADHEVAVEDVLTWVRSRAVDLDGVTVSGGEPFEQPGALGDLLEGLAAVRAGRGVGRAFDVLCYSGYPLPVLRRRHAPLLALLDAVVTGPYVQARAAALPLRGSTNQRVTALTALGRERYGHLEGVPADSTAAPAAPAHLQVAGGEGTIWYIGIPRPGDMERLDVMLRERGVHQGQVSWLG